MRKFILILIAAASLSATARAQAAQDGADAQAAAGALTRNQPVVRTFGYLSYDSVLHAMPDYAVACRQIAELRSRYDAEAKRAEEEFNGKYEEFLDGQSDFPPTILQKRQSELQELLDKNIKFREESRRLLADAERDILAPLHARLAAMLRTIGEERGYAFIINTDGNACPFINPMQGEDIGPLTIERLK